MLENWIDAPVSASNLSELHLTLGDVTDAVAMGEASVAHADRSEDALQRAVNCTTLADALHQAGERLRAKELFEKAAARQAGREPDYPIGG